MAANFSACVHSSRYHSIGRGVPYLAHPRRVRRSSDGSSMAHLSLIYRSSVAQLGSSWLFFFRLFLSISLGLFFFRLFLSISLGRSSWLIYRSAIAHLRGHRLVGVLPYSALTAFGRSHFAADRSSGRFLRLAFASCSQPARSPWALSSWRCARGIRRQSFAALPWATFTAEGPGQLAPVA
jgi:hypothetical protein